MAHTYIKICGLTTVEQVEACVELGADWLGFNCYEKSSRYISPEKIKELLSVVPPTVTTAGVFVNETTVRVNEIVEESGMTFAQLHGDESKAYTKDLNCSYFKAFRVSPDFELDWIHDFGQDTFLLDSYHPNLYGGTGDPFNWDIAIEASKRGSLLLAGGLNTDNVRNAVEKVRPFGVDVCSGVEASPGIKDLNLVKQFIAQVRKADESN